MTKAESCGLIYPASGCVEPSNVHCRYFLAAARMSSVVAPSALRNRIQVKFERAAPQTGRVVGATNAIKHLIVAWSIQLGERIV